MKNSSTSQPASSHPLESYGDPRNIQRIFYWFLALIALGFAIGAIILIAANTPGTAFGLAAIAVGSLPILASTYFVHRQKFEWAATLLAMILMVLITALATNSLGIHHISNLAFPVILVIASLVMRKRVMALLTLFAIGCAAWLVFGELSGAYTPSTLVRSVPGDFFTVALIIILTAVMVRLITESLFRTNSRLQKELDVRTNLIKQLEEKNAELERFTYTVSHDLKTPLVTIGGFLGSLEQDATTGNTERLHDDIQRIQKAVNRMQRLLSELLELSRIGRLMNPPEPIPFEGLAREALVLVHGQLELRGVTFSLGPDLPVVYGDRLRLIEVLQNLIDNAVKFMGDQPHPHIEIGQRGEEDGKPIFYVKDNGIGIPPEYHERIFGLFNKLDTKSEGTGIGLALVKRIVEFHGGKIWVESAAGKGATFYFTLATHNSGETV